MDGSNGNTTEHRPQSSTVHAAGRTSSRQDVDGYQSQTESTDASISDVDERQDPEALEITKTKSNAASIAESMPLYRELLFVAVICCGQLYTRECTVLEPSLVSRTLYL